MNDLASVGEQFRFQDDILTVRHISGDGNGAGPIRIHFENVAGEPYECDAWELEHHLVNGEVMRLESNSAASPDLNERYAGKSRQELNRLEDLEIGFNLALNDAGDRVPEQLLDESRARQTELARVQRLKQLTLPAGVQLPAEIGAGASPWLDRYIAFSRVWSPRAFDDFHEAVGVWALSTVAARRVVLHMGQDFFPSLFIALVARSTVFVKSTTARMGRGLLHQCDLDLLLAPNESTPQRFIYDLSGRVPPDFDEMTPREQIRTRNRLALSGQRGWYSDEFGSFMEAMNRRDGIMAEFRGLLRTFDNNEESYETATHVRGHVHVERPYLALLANLTPADIRPFARRGSRLWGDGFWARFAFVAPPKTEKPRFGRFPDGEIRYDPELTEPLKNWHKRLGMPNVTIENVTDEEGKPTGRKRVIRDDCPCKTCQLGPGVVDAYYRYQDALVEIAYYLEGDDLAPNYGRFAEKAMRIAILLGSLENQDRIELRHWARGQEIAERWRVQLHKLFDQANETNRTETVDREQRVVEILGRTEWATPREISQRIRGLSVGETLEILEKMRRAGAVLSQKTKVGTFRYALAKDVDL